MKKKLVTSIQTKEAIRYMTLCNLIETIWLNKDDKEYYEVDFKDLAPFTSPQARKIASFIDSLYA